IDSGAFSQIILNQIAARAHFIVILTPSALERCNEPHDWLRQEIEHALDLKRNIVPLMFDRFDFRNAQPYLTGKLSLLQQYNALEVPVAYFEEAMGRLQTRFLNVSLDVVIHPTPPENVAEVERKIEVADSLPVPTENQLTAEQYFERALNRSESDYEGKIADYTEIIRLNPEFTEVYLARGSNRHNTGDYEGEIADYTEAIRLGSEHFGVYNNRGEAYFIKGDYAKAGKDFEKAIMSFPECPMSTGGLAIAYHALDYIPRALDLWRQLIAKDERYKDADWTGKHFNWRSELIEEARKLIAKL
ncbi:MAG TPA: tetratricopeptide repeat protein, partial [Phototrophicaceae bacterium]|nr:tetratricopeptide repeat protein [Phototrophicaceae bacterium]